jgi:hypothetical protein
VAPFLAITGSALPALLLAVQDGVGEEEEERRAPSCFRWFRDSAENLSKKKKYHRKSLLANWWNFIVTME